METHRIFIIKKRNYQNFVNFQDAECELLAKCIF